MQKGAATGGAPVEVIFIVLPLAIVLAAVALSAFFWAVHRGQFDDLDTPRYRAIFEDDEDGRAAARSRPSRGSKW